MGMESFFIVALPNSIDHVITESGNHDYQGNSSVLCDDAIKLIKSLPKSKKLTSFFDYKVQDFFLLKLFCENEKLITINIEACLWYLCNQDEKLLELLTIFQEKDLRLFHPEVGYLNNCVDFIEKLRIFYKKKMEIFIMKYGYLFRNKNILPGKYFYDVLNRKQT